MSEMASSLIEECNLGDEDLLENGAAEIKDFNCKKELLNFLQIKTNHYSDFIKTYFYKI